MKKYYLGVDVGSVSTDMVLMNPEKRIEAKIYMRTLGRPIESVQQGMREIFKEQKEPFEILGVGTTGSGRRIAAAVLGADAIKNEITAHSTAALEACPGVRTIMEIGGQDSKIMFLEDGMLKDFAMNTVCAAGTGSFLDRQAERMGMEIGRLGELAAACDEPAPIAGRCAVFAESDMIHSQQEGVAAEKILGGLCQALVRNYLGNLAAGRILDMPIVFQGGVAANQGIVKAFERELRCDIIIPEYYNVMGAWGAAILAKEVIERGAPTCFRGSRAMEGVYTVQTKSCNGCVNHCEVRMIYNGEERCGCWGGRCDRYS